MCDKKNNVVDILTRQDHVSGGLQCTNCNHSWVGVFPTGAFGFDCPKCNLSRGIPAALVIPEVYFVCGCQSAFFTISKDGPLCIQCGNIPDLEDILGD